MLLIVQKSAMDGWREGEKARGGLERLQGLQDKGKGGRLKDETDVVIFED